MAVRKGQVSTEVLILIGLMLLLLLPLLVYAFNRSGAAKDDLTMQKSEFAAQRLARLSDSVGYLGGAAAIVDEVEIPANVKNITINGRDIIFEIDSPTGRLQIVKSSSFGLRGVGLDRVVKEGTYWFEVSAISVDDPESNYTQVQIRVK